MRCDKMNKAENNSFWFQAGAAILGKRAMQAFSQAAITVAASGPGADDFLQCAVQSAVGALRIVAADEGQEARFKRHLKDFLPGYTKVSFADLNKNSCDLLGANCFMAVSFNVSHCRERAFAEECAQRKISFTSTVSAGCGFLVKYVPAGSPYTDTRPACDRLLTQLASAKAPDWASGIAGSAAGFQTWNFIQTRFCTQDNKSPQFLLMDLWTTRWCMDNTIIARALAQKCPPGQIPWQQMQTKTP